MNSNFETFGGPAVLRNVCFREERNQHGATQLQMVLHLRDRPTAAVVSFSQVV